MAFKEFTNRSVQYPNRVTLNLVPGTTNTYDKVRAEGTVFAEGVMFNEAEMNDFQEKMGTWSDVTSLFGKNSFVGNHSVLYNPAIREIRVSLECDSTAIAPGSALLTIPTAYTPTSNITIYNGGTAKSDASLGVFDWNPATITIATDRNIKASFTLASNMRYLQADFSYIVR